MVVVVVHLMIGWQHLMIGLILGLVNAFLVDLFVLTIRKGNQGKFQKGWKLFLNVLINILIAITLSLLIRLIDFQLLKAELITIPIEPFRFIAYYQIMYYGFGFGYNKIKSYIERKKHESNT
jgi:peptidoglycan biosynthesis protein MviN/MurJ (putative lipid II flippase)